MNLGQWETATQLFVALGGVGVLGGIIKWVWKLGKRTENLERKIQVLNTALESVL